MLASSGQTDVTERFDKKRVRELFAEYATGKSEEIREELVLAHLNLVRYLASRFANRGETLEDLTQVGALGLLKAIERFDPARGLEFSTYAMPTVIGELKRHFRDKGWAMRVPRRMQELNLAINRLTETLPVELGRSATVDDIAKKLDATDEEVIEAQELGHAYRLRSLESDFAGSDQSKPSPLRERIGGDDPDLSFLEDKISLERACQQLERKERLVIYLRFFEEVPQAEIARRLNVSQMYISRIQQRAIAKLRKMLTCLS